MTELKPCPFCGCDEIMLHHGSLAARRIVGKYWCYCMGCRASSGIYTTDKEAIEAWNRRDSNGYHSGHWIKMVDSAFEYYCSECEIYMADDNPNYCPNCGAKMNLEAEYGDKELHN